MLTIIRIITAAAILTGWCHVAPARAASGDASRQAVHAASPVSASAAEATCPLRAWPYVG
ncbi:hypothetical protein OPKNFCMD_5685 [Methylobacterium crusticola]|uniref:Porin n=1 Tax=Methylobacterium crusticola TaxID=1697972 RepID=A0ABQ4R5G3_9HYPH|nr:hypothetical protein [Methylobacterium crusticola]GJD52918.1 hypothetical protein OPKNFCMD_5685 [Methylobacterium crusticola]